MNEMEAAEVATVTLWQRLLKFHRRKEVQDAEWHAWIGLTAKGYVVKPWFFDGEEGVYPICQKFELPDDFHYDDFERLIWVTT